MVEQPSFTNALGASRSTPPKVSEVVVHDIHELRRVLKEFMAIQPGGTYVMAVKGENGRDINLKTDIQGDPKSMLIEGFNKLKKRVEAQAKLKEGTPSPIRIDGHMWLDDLIKRRLGGQRDGLRIKWELPDGTYYFDPFTSKLTQKPADDTNNG
jgi:hypothetical protein